MNTNQINTDNDSGYETKWLRGFGESSPAYARVPWYNLAAVQLLGPAVLIPWSILLQWERLPEDPRLLCL